MPFLFNPCLKMVNPADASGDFMCCRVVYTPSAGELKLSPLNEGSDEVCLENDILQFSLFCCPKPLSSDGCDRAEVGYYLMPTKVAFFNTRCNEYFTMELPKI